MDSATCLGSRPSHMALSNMAAWFIRKVTRGAPKRNYQQERKGLMDELEGEGRKGPAWQGQSGVVGAAGRSQDQRESPRGKGRSCLHQAGHQGVCWWGVSGHSWGQRRKDRETVLSFSYLIAL